MCVYVCKCACLHVSCLPPPCPALSVSVIGAVQFQSSRESVEGEQEQFLFLLAECIRVLIEGKSWMDMTLLT